MRGRALPLVLAAACGDDLRPAAPDAAAACAPTWQVVQVGTAAPEQGVRVAVDDRCRVTLVGSTFGALAPGGGGSEDVFVHRLPDDGGDGWTRQLGSPSWDQVGGVLATADGGVIVAGTTSGVIVPGGSSAGDDDVLVLALDDAGATRWIRQHGAAGPDRGLALARSPDGGLRVAGARAPDPLTDVDATVDQLDGDGRWQATQTLATAGRDDRGEAIVVDAAGEAVVGGGTAGPLVGAARGSFDGFVVALPAPGAPPRWGDQPGTGDIDAILDLALDADGDLIVLAVSMSDLATGALENDGVQSTFVARYRRGEPGPRWVRRVGPAAFKISARALALDGAGRIHLAGSTGGALGGPAAGGLDAFHAVLDRDGAPLGFHQLGSPADDLATDLALTPAGEVIVAGTTAGDLTGRGAHAGMTDAFAARLPATP